MSKKKKRNTNSKTKRIFFAYQSAAKSDTCDNVDAINNAVRQIGNEAITWEKLKISGNLINKEILRQIDQSDIFACDMTYQNPNVYFELGYAIGKKKSLYILLNPDVKNAKLNYENIDILKNIGFTTFTNSTHIINGLLSQTDLNQVLLEQITTFTAEDIDSTDVFYIQSKGTSQAEMDVLQFLKVSDYTLICKDPCEVSYQPLEWYIHSLLASKYIIVHLISDKMSDSNMINAKNSLFAGIGHALGKKVLLIAPKPYCAPIDYADILDEYSSATECVDKVKSWLPKKSKKCTYEGVKEEEKDLNLLKLGIGCYVAEEEKCGLLEYFIETQSYREAFKTRNSIFYGRKGTGKTALYFKLIEEYTDEDNVYIINLKPESIELVEQIKGYELISDYANKKSIFNLVWKEILLSNLLISIYTKISNAHKIEYTNEEQAIFGYYKGNEETILKSFLSIVNEALGSDSKITNIVEYISSVRIVPLEKIIREFLFKTKYTRIIILADNLDKAWDSKSDLDIQADMILSLLEVTGKFQANLINKKDNEIITNSILFLRKDIFNYILNCAREPDKLLISSHEIEWNSHPELLKTLVNERIKIILGLSDDYDINKIWGSYFELGKEDPFDKVIKACIPRPRDIIYFFANMFESACNKSHKSVLIDDFNFALDKYIFFLYQNLIAEMNVTYPYIKCFIDEFHNKFNDEIEINQFRKSVFKYEQNPQKAKQFISDLFNNGYLVGIYRKTKERIFSYEDLLKIEEKTKHKKWMIFNKEPIYIIHHSRYDRLRIK